MNNCGSCKYVKERGWSVVYCTFFGINISAGYNRCRYHADRIATENGNGEIIIKPAHEDVRERQVS